MKKFGIELIDTRFSCSVKMLERYILSPVRYESELHNHTIAHRDASVLPDNEVNPLKTRSNHMEQYGARPDNYGITYIMQILRKYHVWPGFQEIVGKKRGKRLMIYSGSCSRVGRST